MADTRDLVRGTVASRLDFRLEWKTLVLLSAWFLFRFGACPETILDHHHELEPIGGSVRGSDARDHQTGGGKRAAILVNREEGRNDGPELTEPILPTKAVPL